MTPNINKINNIGKFLILLQVILLAIARVVPLNIVFYHFILLGIVSVFGFVLHRKLKKNRVGTILLITSIICAFFFITTLITTITNIANMTSVS
jgi:hypothetical protein